MINHSERVSEYTLLTTEVVSGLFKWTMTESISQIVKMAEKKKWIEWLYERIIKNHIVLHNMSYQNFKRESKYIIRCSLIFELRYLCPFK